MKYFKIQYILLTLLLVSSCAEDSPFLTKKEATKIINDLTTERDPFHGIKDVVAIINNDVYYFARLDSVPKQITFTPTQIKKMVKLSADKSRIAYINSAGNPVIIGIDGKLIKTLTQYNYIDQMDWAKQQNTLYLLSGNKVYTYGDALTVKQPVAGSSWDDVPSYSMNGIGDYAYQIKRYGDYVYRLYYHSNLKGKDGELYISDAELYNFNYVDFYDNKGNFLLGYSNYPGEPLTRIVCVEDYNFYSKYEWDGEGMNSPTFNSDLEVLLYGTVGNNNYRVKAVYLGTDAYGDGLSDILTKTLTQYTSKTPVYVDWVQ